VFTGCKSKHLIADNLGWFRDTKYNVEVMAQEKGEELRRMKTEDLIDAPEDIKQQIIEAQKTRMEWLHRKKPTEYGPLEDTPAQSESATVPPPVGLASLKPEEK
jgi:hypothetical protein